MKKILFSKPVNLPRLAEELFAAFPSWKHIENDGIVDRLVTRVSVKENEIEFPDDTDEAAVQAVIDAHDPNVQSVNQEEEVKATEATTEFDNAPAWIKDLNYPAVETYIQNNTVGSVTKAQALTAVDNAASLADVKVILRNLVEAVYGMVGINQKLARVVLAVIFFVKRRR